MFRTGPRSLLCQFLLAAQLGTAWASSSDQALERRASWTSPTLPEVRARLDAWLVQLAPPSPAFAAIDSAWTDLMEQEATADRLQRVAEIIAMAEPSAEPIVEFCRQEAMPPLVPAFALLADENTAPFVRDHLRLLLARRLSQHAMYDESLALIADLKPEDVVDPACLLFYQAVGRQRLLDKDASLAALARLLEHRGQLPRRYETTALLMQADLENLQADSLDEVARLMDDIERRLGFGRAGRKVRQEEEDVLAKLDKMIEEMEEQQEQRRKQQQSGGSAAAPKKPMEDSVPAGGSGPGQVDGKETGSGVDWGNLPPKERQEALQRIGKGLPSHYREVIEEYFRKLARDGKE